MKYGIIKCVVSSKELLPTDKEIKKRAIATVKCKYPFPDDEAYHDFQEFINGFEQGAKWVRNLRREESK